MWNVLQIKAKNYKLFNICSPLLLSPFQKDHCHSRLACCSLGAQKGECLCRDWATWPLEGIYPGEWERDMGTAKVRATKRIGWGGRQDERPLPWAEYGEERCERLLGDLLCTGPRGGSHSLILPCSPCLLGKLGPTPKSLTPALLGVRLRFLIDGTWIREDQPSFGRRLTNRLWKSALASLH